jgi:ATP-dependent Clp protease ATP-binding subunit ClpA
VGKTALIWEIARQSEQRGVEGRIWETTASILIKELTKQTGWQDNLSFLCQELTKTRDMLFIRNLMELFEVGKYEGNDMAIADFLRAYLSRGEITLISECTDEEMALIELRSPNYLTFFQIIRLEEPREELERIILRKVLSIAQSRKMDISEEAIREVIRLNRRFLPYSGMPGKPIRFLESLLITEKKRSAITRQEVIRYFCEESGMPAFIIDPQVPMHAAEVRRRFNSSVFGQERAVDVVVDRITFVKTALTRTGQPIASLLFVGPTGVGKTEMAKVLAEFMFGSRDRLTRFDMSEFSSPYAVMRLIGTGYFSDGLLTSAVRREPFSVILFDEIEKAHSSFNDLLLQILSEGRLTDSQGKLVNFCSAIIIMTSNLGAAAKPADKLEPRADGDRNARPFSQRRPATFPARTIQPHRPDHPLRSPRSTDAAFYRGTRDRTVPAPGGHPFPAPAPGYRRGGARSPRRTRLRRQIRRPPPAAHDPRIAHPAACPGAQRTGSRRPTGGAGPHGRHSTRHIGRRRSAGA